MAWLPQHGYNVFLFDYRGFGLSQGRASLPDIYWDIDAAFAWLRQREGEQNIFLLGQSIGGALGTYWLGQPDTDRQGIKAFVIDGSFSSFNNMVQFVADSFWLTWPFQYPASWSFSSDYNPIEHSENIQVPILQFHSIEDAIVPYQEGQNLYESFTSPKKFITVDGRHIKTFEQQQNRQQMLDFLELISKHN